MRALSHEVEEPQGQEGHHSFWRQLYAAAAGSCRTLRPHLKEGGFEVKLFEGVESDPSIETVMKGAEAMREFEPDWIIAIGGGSPIDAR